MIRSPVEYRRRLFRPVGPVVVPVKVNPQGKVVGGGRPRSGGGGGGGETLVLPTATWDPAANSNFVLSSGNLQADDTGILLCGVKSTTGHSAGKHYAEITGVLMSSSPFDISVGIRRSDEPAATGFNLGKTCVLRCTGAGYAGDTGATVNAVKAWSSNSVMCLAYDAPGGKLWIGDNGTWIGGGNPATGANPTISGIPAGTWHLFCAADNNNATQRLSLNAGASAFAYAVPAGFRAGWGS